MKVGEGEREKGGGREGGRREGKEGVSRYLAGTKS